MGEPDNKSATRDIPETGLGSRTASATPEIPETGLGSRTSATPEAPETGLTRGPAAPGTELGSRTTSATPEAPETGLGSLTTSTTPEIPETGLWSRTTSAIPEGPKTASITSATPQIPETGLGSLTSATPEAPGTELWSRTTSATPEAPGTELWSRTSATPEAPGTELWSRTTSATPEAPGTELWSRTTSATPEAPGTELWSRTTSATPEAPETAFITRASPAAPETGLGSRLTSAAPAGPSVSGVSIYSDASSGGEFWLPEFADLSPQTSPPSTSSTQIKGYQRRSEDMAMKVLSDHFYVAVHDMKPVTTCIQPCRCYVCSLVQIMANSVKEPVPPLELKFVEHGRNGYTVYDKARPWDRLVVHNCTNPLPLARRMPVVVKSPNGAACSVYRKQMLRPGKVLKNTQKHTEFKDCNPFRTKREQTVDYLKARRLTGAAVQLW